MGSKYATICGARRFLRCQIGMGFLKHYSRVFHRVLEAVRALRRSSSSRILDWPASSSARRASSSAIRASRSPAPPSDAGFRHLSALSSCSPLTASRPKGAVSTVFIPDPFRLEQKGWSSVGTSCHEFGKKRFQFLGDNAQVIYLIIGRLFQLKRLTGTCMRRSCHRFRIPDVFFQFNIR